MFSAHKIRNEAMELASVAAGGYLASWISPYTKKALHDVVNYTVNLGNYRLQQGPYLRNIRANLSEDENYEQVIIKTYATWHISYNENSSPLTAYVCTQRGFFQISLSSGSILQALPSNNPKLSLNILPIYSDLNVKMNVEPDDTEKNIMEKVKWLCLVNMILRDLQLIFNSTSIKKEIVPEFFKQFISILYDLSTNSTTTQIANINTEIQKIVVNPGDWKSIRNFLHTYCKKLNNEKGQSTFYKMNDQKKNHEIDSTSMLGMVFHYKISNFVLYINNEKFQDGFLSESVLRTGSWAKVLSLHYDVLACE